MIDFDPVDHKVFHSMAHADEEDMIDVQDIYCSVCGLDTEDDSENDIVLCDRVGCNKAYHLLCLDPPMQSLEKAGCYLLLLGPFFRICSL